MSMHYLIFAICGHAFQLEKKETIEEEWERPREKKEIEEEEE